MARAGFFAIENSSIRFGRDGRWYADGEPIENRRIADLFSRHLERAPQGGYRLRIGEETAPIEVEDTPYVVVEVTVDEAGRFGVRLNDGLIEPLDAASLEVGEAEVLSCAVKQGKERARFLRSAYYQIARHFVEVEAGVFALVRGGTSHRIRRQQR